MDETPADPSLAISDAVTRPPLELPIHPSQSVQHSVDKDFHSSSLPHLGDFMAKLLDDAHKLQSLNAELEHTKQKLREAEDKLASAEEFKFPLSTQLNRVKQQLRSTENALKREQKKNAKLEADNTWLNASLSNHQDWLGGTESLRIEAENKLQTAENCATILEADLRKKNDALEQKDEEMQMKIRGYRALLRRLVNQVDETVPIFDLLTHYIFSGVNKGRIPRTFNDKDIQEELERLLDMEWEIYEGFAEMCGEFKRDLRQTRASAGSHA